jgi:3-keto-5-aminohexanoate cleavage enzyme
LPKLIITCAITGSTIQKEETPFIPITPEEIAESAIEAVKAGASVIHIHVRDPQTHVGAQDRDIYERVLTLITKEVDPVICLSTSGVPGKNLEHDKRLIPLELHPDMVSFDAGSMNFGSKVFLNPPDFLKLLAQKAKECKVKLELECFHAGMVSTCLDMMNTGMIERPLHFQLVLGVKGGTPATLKSLLSMIDMIPDDATWSIIGIGKSQLAMAMASMVMDGHVRVGLEDNIYYAKGILAKSNAELVERIVRISREYGRDVATPQEAREILGLKPERKVP